MNLIERFPDISMQIREKSLRRQKRPAARTPRAPAITPAQYQRKEFRKWHVKMLLIITLLLGGIYLIILNSPWMFSLVNAVRI